jgi:biopolymer transport protein ExbD
MRLARKHRGRQLLLDMTPMIDIVFQLLIFFLVTAQMVKHSRADMELPKERGEQNQVAEEAGVIINVLATGQIIIGESEVQLNEMEQIIREAVDAAPGKRAEAVKLTIRADRRTPTTHLNDVIERLHKLGVGAARIATSPSRN